MNADRRGARIEIVGARVIDPASGRDKPGSIFLAEGRIAALDKAPDGFRADETLDAKGLTAMPGLVDLSARLREPGFEYKATLESELRAAAAGGVTTLACPPDTDPPLDEPGLVEMLTRRASGLERGRVHPLGALTVGLKGERLAEMALLADAGCKGFSQGNAALPGTATLWNAFKYAATFGFTVWLRPQEAELSANGVAHEGEIARAWASRRSRSSRRPSRCARSSRSCRPPARACTSRGCRRPPACGSSRGQGGRRARSPATWACTISTSATATSATSTPTAT
jgi:dihydroorotase-like cyclic amidohydrolase